MTAISPINPQSAYWPPVAPAQQPAIMPGQSSQSFALFEQDLANTVALPEYGTPGISWAQTLLHPFKTRALAQALKINLTPVESFDTRSAMYKALQDALSGTGKDRLNRQLMLGRLTRVRSQDGLSTLAHLYNILMSPRAKGLNNIAVLEDTLRILNAPQSITQQPGEPNINTRSRLEAYYNSGMGPRLKDPVTPDILQNNTSATCVASSLMDDMATQNPEEFTRQIDGLTNPRRAFYQRVSATDISPDDPSAAPQKLKDYEIPATPIAGSQGTQYLIKVDLPYSGLLITQNQQQTPQGGTRGIVETAYQSALTRLVARSYDPGLDMRINPDGTLDTNKGLEEDRVALMESIIEGNGGVLPITYQLTVSKPSDPDNPYLMGYERNFEQTTQDLMRALDMGKTVEVGITDTENQTPSSTGRIDMGHELRIVGYRRDPGANDIIFQIFDSDDNNPNLVERYATELVPKIHHADYPTALARQIQAEMKALPENQWLVPDQQEGRRYQLIATVPVDQQQQVMKDYQQMLQQDNGATTMPINATSPISAQSSYGMPPTSSNNSQYGPQGGTAYPTAMPMQPANNNGAWSYSAPASASFSPYSTASATPGSQSSYNASIGVPSTSNTATLMPGGTQPATFYPSYNPAAYAASANSNTASYPSGAGASYNPYGTTAANNNTPAGSTYSAMG